MSLVSPMRGMRVNRGIAVTQGIIETPKLLGLREAIDNKIDRRELSGRNDPTGPSDPNDLKSSPGLQIDDPLKQTRGMLPARRRETGPPVPTRHHGGTSIAPRIERAGPREMAEVVGVAAAMIAGPHEIHTRQHRRARVHHLGARLQPTLRDRHDCLKKICRRS